jgi:hypothetical protein
MVAAMRSGPTERWLEPCVGEGVFLRALASVGVPAKRIFAIDLESCGVPEDRLAQTLRGVDFLSWSGITSEKFDRIIGNPPFISLKNIGASLKASALAVAPDEETQLSLKSNCWVAFLQASLSLLTTGGSLCFVLPASWDYADYARPLKERLQRSFSHLEVHRCKRPMFGEVQEGCVVLIARGYGGVSGVPVRYEHHTPEALITSLKNGNSVPSTIAGIPSISEPRQIEKTELLGSVMDIHLGGVTGDNSYFLLKESERIALKLPRACLRPALSKARHLLWGEITPNHWVKLRDADQRVWLFRPSPSQLNHPAVKAYLELDQSLGGCNRKAYKIKNRNPWHETPLPRQIDAFISGMTHVGPWLCLKSMPDLTATNTLYIAKFRSQFSADEKSAWALSLLTSSAKDGLHGRVYPDGLIKYEPGDLVKARLPRPKNTKGARPYYSRVIRTLLCGDSDEATRMADRWFGRSG